MEEVTKRRVVNGFGVLIYSGVGSLGYQIIAHPYRELMEKRYEKGLKFDELSDSIGDALKSGEPITEDQISEIYANAIKLKLGVEKGTASRLEGMIEKIKKYEAGSEMRETNTSLLDMRDSLAKMKESEYKQGGFESGVLLCLGGLLIISGISGIVKKLYDTITAR